MKAMCGRVFFTCLIFVMVIVILMLLAYKSSGDEGAIGVLLGSLVPFIVFSGVRALAGDD